MTYRKNLRDIEVSLSAQAAEPGVGDGHHLHPDGARLGLFGCRARLVQPPRAAVARIDHDGDGVLRRDAGGCFGSSRQAEHLQYRSGLAVHTGSAFTSALANNDITISMDGKGAWRDNVFVERLCSSVKYEEVYLRAYDSVSEARSSIGCVEQLRKQSSRYKNPSGQLLTSDCAYFSRKIMKENNPA
jgi:transposase InsO family protein